MSEPAPGQSGGAPFVPFAKAKASGSFALSLVLTLAVVGGVLAPLGTLLLINEYEDVGNLWLYDLYLRKDHAAKIREGKGPRVFFVGGSNVLFGIDAELVERRLGVGAVNYGTHAGLQVPYHLERITRRARPGDVVVLSLEYEQLAQESEEFTELRSRYAWSFDTPHILAQSPRRAVRLLYGVPTSRYLSSLYSLNDWLRGVEPPAPGDFSSIELSPNGDAERTLSGRQQLIALPIPEKCGAAVSRAFSELSSWALKHDLKLAVTWHPAPFSGAPTSPELKGRLQNIRRFFTDHGVVELDSPEDQFYPDELFADSSYHLNPAGRRLRTEKIVRSLGKLLGKDAPATAPRPVFLMGEPGHRVTAANSLSDQPGVQVAYFMPAGSASPDVITADLAKAHLAAGDSLYFDDGIVNGLVADLGLRKELVASSVVHADALARTYPNHLVAVISAGRKRDCGGSSDGPLAQLSRDACAGPPAFLAAVFGTGSHRSTQSIAVDREAARQYQCISNPTGPLAAHPMCFDLVGTERMPTPDAADSGGARMRINGVSFAPPRRGLFAVVVEPASGVVVRSGMLESQNPFDAYYLWRTRGSPASPEVARESALPDFVAIGAVKPTVSAQGATRTITFPTKEGVWGVYLNRRPWKARQVALHLRYRLRTPGQVVLSVRCLSPEPLLVPRSVVLEGLDQWNEAEVSLELKPDAHVSEDEWVVAGLVSATDGCVVEVESATLVWREP